MKPPRKRLDITTQPGLSAALARTATRDFTSSVSRASAGRSFADLLSDLYAQADNLIADIASSGEPAIKRAEALKSVAKILPLLQAAERNARASIKGKATEDMEADELRDLARAILAADEREPNKTSNSPNQGTAARGNPHTLNRTKKSVAQKKIADSAVGSFPTSNLSDEELNRLLKEEEDEALGTMEDSNVEE